MRSTGMPPNEIHMTPETMLDLRRWAAEQEGLFDVPPPLYIYGMKIVVDPVVVAHRQLKPGVSMVVMSDGSVSLSTDNINWHPVPRIVYRTFFR
jgi:hypothetical protein